MSIETFLLFATICIVVMTVVGFGLAIFVCIRASKEMDAFERRFAERSDFPRRRFRL